MAGRLHGAMKYLGLVDDEDEYDEHDDYVDDEHYDDDPTSGARVLPRDERPAVRTVNVRDQRRVQAVSFEAEPAPPVRAPEPQLSRITTLHPRNYNDARTIGEQFRNGVPVVMDVTEMEDADAKRLVDFAAGLTFGLQGRIEKVTRGVFLLSPMGIAVTLDNSAGIVEGGFYNQS